MVYVAVLVILQSLGFSMYHFIGVIDNLLRLSLELSVLTVIEIYFMMFIFLSKTDKITHVLLH